MGSRIRPLEVIKHGLLAAVLHEIFARQTFVGQDLLYCSFFVQKPLKRKGFSQFDLKQKKITALLSLGLRVVLGL